MGDAEKKLWTELEPLIRALLEELKKNGHIETVHANTEYEDLSSMLDNLEQSSKTYIAMMRIDDKDKLESFLGAVKGFGHKEEKITAESVPEMERSRQVVSPAGGGLELSHIRAGILEMKPWCAHPENPSSFLLFSDSISECLVLAGVE